MSESATLLALLVALYLSECAIWAPRGALVFIGRQIGRFRVLRPSTLLGNDRGGLVWGNPLPPFGSAFQCSGWQSTDIEAVRRRLDQFRHQAGSLRGWCHLLFLMLLVVLPALLFSGWILVFWPQYLSLLAIILAIILRKFWVAHRRLYPLSAGRRWNKFLIMLLTPTAAIRAYAILGRDLLAEFHPLAVALVLCDAEVAKGLARPMLRQLRYPRAGGPAETQPAADEAGRAVEALLEGQGYSIDDLLRAPEPTDPSHLTFCPRCETQYILHEGTCSDCGLPLASLDRAMRRL